MYIVLCSVLYCILCLVERTSTYSLEISQRMCQKRSGCFPDSYMYILPEFIKLYFRDCFVHQSFLPCIKAVNEQKNGDNYDPLTFYKGYLKHITLFFSESLRICFKKSNIYPNEYFELLLICLNIYLQCYAFMNSNYYNQDPRYKYKISRNYLDAAVEICLFTHLINPETK